MILAFVIGACWTGCAAYWWAMFRVAARADQEMQRLLREAQADLTRYRTLRVVR